MWHFETTRHLVLVLCKYHKWISNLPYKFFNFLISPRTHMRAIWCIKCTKYDHKQCVGCKWQTLGKLITQLVLEERCIGEGMLIFYAPKNCEASNPEISAWFLIKLNKWGTHWTSLYSLNWDFPLSQINIWVTTTWSNVWVVLQKPTWYEFLIGFLIWTPASQYLHLTTFSNICVILSMFSYV